MKHRVWFLMSAVAVVMLALVAAAPARAGGDPGVTTARGRCNSPTDGHFMLSYSVTAVTHGMAAEITLKSNGADARAYFNLSPGDDGTLVVDIDSGIASASVPVTGSGPYGTHYVDGSPSGKATGTVEVKVYTESGYHSMATYSYDCSSGSMVIRRIFVREGTRALPPYTGIHLQSAVFAAPYLDVPNNAGLKPCGVFDVNGWGRKYIGLGDFPACQPPDLTVLCLNDARQWVAGAVSDVYVRPDGAELDFTSRQHGICGIFPAK